jgi:hypothetical protein
LLLINFFYSPFSIYDQLTTSNNRRTNFYRLLYIFTKIMTTFVTLPVELVYRIFDHLTNFHLFHSVQSVCHRFNQILDTYVPYQVKLYLYFYIVFVKFVSL